MRKNLWQRWKRLAHRAAEIQAFVLLTLVYWIMVAPIGVVLKAGRHAPSDGWKTRPAAGPASIDDARRQS